jgi:hypothetical protein
MNEYVVVCNILTAHRLEMVSLLIPPNKVMHFQIFQCLLLMFLI